MVTTASLTSPSTFFAEIMARLSTCGATMSDVSRLSDVYLCRHHRQIHQCPIGKLDHDATGESRRIDKVLIVCSCYLLILSGTELEWQIAALDQLLHFGIAVRPTDEALDVKDEALGIFECIALRIIARHDAIRPKEDDAGKYRASFVAKQT